MGLVRGMLTRWAADPPVQVGIAAASWSIAGSFARSLMPRDPVQQAVASGVVAATHYQLGATTWASLQALGARPGARPTLRANLLVSGIGIAGGLGASAAAGRFGDSLPGAAVATAGRITAFSALAGGAGAAWDAVLHRRLGLRPSIATTLLPSVVTAGAVVVTTVWSRQRRAAEYGMVAPERHAVKGANARSIAVATGIGAASAVGFAAATSGEQLLARGLEHAMGRVLGRPTGALGSLIAHGAILGTMALAGGAALSSITARIQGKDDIIEPAYPSPPTSPHVSSGPASAMPFDTLGKEGRRFVLMALSPDDITAVMGEPAIAPVRVVGGFESSTDIAERARLTIQDMHDTGAFERSLIVVGSPTGVGYFNYSIAEALEYLTRGDCAIVVPQYALVPSALALSQTTEAEELTRLVLAGIREAIADRPNPPRVVLIGESLGANIALDLSADASGRCRIPNLAELGVDAGLYLGVPFRTRTWNQWRADVLAVDPEGLLHLVSQPDEIDPPAPGESRHLMVIHHDDPVNKYGFEMVVRAPWWMGPPPTRPPLVPREAKFRPITSFVLATVDLLNGMQSRPGTFVRRGHDYRIDIREGLERAFGLRSSPEQAEGIEAALREREQEWAMRRMIARKLDRARRSIERQLAEWGTPNIEIADLDPTGAPAPGPLGRLGLLSAPPGA